MNATDRFIIFRCPVTGLDVQTLLSLRQRDDDEDGRGHYETVNCPVCANLHFVNLKTGKTLGMDK